MIDEETKMDNIIKDEEANKSNGMFFVLYIFLVSFNVLITVLMGFSLSGIMNKYLYAIGIRWIRYFYYLNNSITGILVVWGFIIGLGINNLKLSSWKQFKIYLIIQYAFFIILIAVCYKIVSIKEVQAFIVSRNLKVSSYISDFKFRIASSTIIFLFWFIYAINSKKAKTAFVDKVKK